MSKLWGSLQKRRGLIFLKITVKNSSRASDLRQEQSLCLLTTRHFFAIIYGYSKETLSFAPRGRKTDSEFSPEGEHPTNRQKTETLLRFFAFRHFPKTQHRVIFEFNSLLDLFAHISAITFMQKKTKYFGVWRSWQRATFGMLRPQVRTLSLRPKRLRNQCS